MTIVSGLDSVPSQELYYSSPHGDFTLEIRTNMCGIMMMSVRLDGKYLARNLRCFPGLPVLPHEWQRKSGNFIFITGGDDYPYYTDFGGSCLLYYLEPGEEA